MLPNWYLLMNDEKLIDLVRMHEEFYNMADRKYNDNIHKDKLWKNIGEILNRPAVQCKARWISLRDQFRKAMKRKAIFAGQPGYIAKKWKYEDEMSFLFPYFRERGNSFGTSDETKEEADEKQSLLGIETLSESSKENFKESPIDSAKNSPGAVQNEIITCYVEEKRENTPMTSTPSGSVDAVEAFFTGIIATVKQFSPYYQNIAKTKIFSIVSEIELKQILENQQYEQPTQSVRTPAEVKTETISSSVVLHDNYIFQEHDGEEDTSDL